MFSPEKIVHSFLDNNKKRSFINLSWQKLFKEFFFTLYFQNHLLHHFYQPYQITMCLGKNLNLEVLNLLNLLTHKYPFFKLRQSELQNLNVDLEHNYLLNSNLSDSKILTSNTCLLIGINPRYEGSKLNLKLRSRYLKGNFNVIHLGSLVNLTFSNTNITSNTKILKSLIEGNNLLWRLCKNVTCRICACVRYNRLTSYCCVCQLYCINSISGHIVSIQCTKHSAAF